MKIIINKWSPTTYLNKDGGIMKEEDFHYQFPAQMASLNRRFFRKYGMELKELDILKTIYLVVTEKNRGDFENKGRTAKCVRTIFPGTRGVKRKYS